MKAHKTKQGFPMYGSWCRPCWNVRQARYEDSKRRKDPQYDMRHYYKKIHGLSLEEYGAMLAAQDGLCAICRKPEQLNQRMAVDHHHESGEIRGLLCFRCNTGIGKFYEDITALARAIEYLKAYAWARQ